jgi:midasin
MRRLIPYIASDYRKDQIWMRRTKCTKRNYQVCIAVDNSQSMRHNHFTEVFTKFESYLIIVFLDYL